MICRTIFNLKEKIGHVGARLDALTVPEDKAIDFAHTHINEEPSKYITENIYSPAYVLAHCGEMINNAYRNGRQIDSSKDIEALVASNTTDKDLVLYRGLCTAVFDLMKKNAKKKGCDLFEKSFLQCSLVKGHESKSQVHLRIFVPAGTQCIYLGNVNEEQHYYEVDLNYGTKLKILSIDKDYINCTVI